MKMNKELLFEIMNPKCYGEMYCDYQFNFNVWYNSMKFQLALRNIDIEEFTIVQLRDIYIRISDNPNCSIEITSGNITSLARPTLWQKLKQQILKLCK
jgi:hypothetical protein